MERGTKPYEDGQHSDVQACEGKQGRGHGVNPPRRELDTAGKMCCMYAQDSALKEVAFGVFSFSVFFFFLSLSHSPPPSFTLSLTTVLFFLIFLIWNLYFVHASSYSLRSTYIPSLKVAF